MTSLASVAAGRASLRHFARIVSGSGFPVDMQGQSGLELPFFKVKDLRSADKSGVLATPNDSITRETARGLGATVIPKGALAFAKVGAALLLGRVGALPTAGCIDNNMSALIIKPSFDLSFARYLMLTFDFRRFVLPGPVPSLDIDGLREFQVPVFSLDEQRAIADYLDQETAQIDALVAKQEEFITLLRERRRATITTAVTKGLKAHPVLTDSGVPSLGSIPAHWSVKKVKYLGRALIGLTYTPAQLVGPGDGGTLVLRANNIQNGCIDLTDNVYVDGPVPHDLRVRSGDILICARNGSARLIGKNAILDSSLAGQTWGAFMAVLRSPFNGYLRWVLNSQVFAANIGLYMTTTVNQLTNATLHNLEVAVPPAQEQQQITAYLDDEISRIDTLMVKTEEHIALAKERRAALITAAVTGQFDVRTARKAG